MRNGRRNHYEVTPGTAFRHPAEGQREIADLLRLLAGQGPQAGAAGRPATDAEGTVEGARP
ncbi:hypothetical protein ACFW6S_01525 [Streptomyces sp. NPDC058740]